MCIVGIWERVGVQAPQKHVRASVSLCLPVAGSPASSLPPGRSSLSRRRYRSSRGSEKTLPVKLREDEPDPLVPSLSALSPRAPHSCPQ